MKKQQYLDALRSTLSRLKVADIDDIAAEYAQHFDFKIADGFTEEEIAAKLGSPAAAAAQFAGEAPAAAKPMTGSKALVYTGLGAADVGAGGFFTLFGAWIAVFAAAALSFMLIAVCLICNINIANLLPPLPYGVGIAMSVALLFLSALCATGTLYCALCLKQMFRAYARWLRNTTAAARNKPVLPSLAKYPQLPPKMKRRLRNALVISLIGFGITLMAAYAIAAITAGAFEFWHVWDWFV